MLNDQDREDVHLARLILAQLDCLVGHHKTVITHLNQALDKILIGISNHIY